MAPPPPPPLLFATTPPAGSAAPTPQTLNPGPLNLSCRFVQGTELWDNIKKFAMASFAMKATERDPEFVDNFCKVGEHVGGGPRGRGGQGGGRRGKGEVGTPDKGVESTSSARWEGRGGGGRRGGKEKGEGGDGGAPIRGLRLTDQD